MLAEAQSDLWVRHRSATVRATSDEWSSEGRQEGYSASFDDCKRHRLLKFRPREEPIAVEPKVESVSERNRETAQLLRRIMEEDSAEDAEMWREFGAERLAIRRGQQSSG
jgi:hypothetical protein